MERKTIRIFEDLIVWQKAIEFVKDVYVIANKGAQARFWVARSNETRSSVDSNEHR